MRRLAPLVHLATGVEVPAAGPILRYRRAVETVYLALLVAALLAMAAGSAWVVAKLLQ